MAVQLQRSMLLLCKHLATRGSTEHQENLAQGADGPSSYESSRVSAN